MTLVCRAAPAYSGCTQCPTWAWGRESMMVSSPTLLWGEEAVLPQPDFREEAFLGTLPFAEET